MGAIALSLIMGLIIVALIKLRAVRAPIAVLCIVFGLIVAATPIGEGATLFVTDLFGWSGDRLERLG